MRLKDIQPQVNPFSDQDMKTIYEAHMADKWSKPMSLQEAFAEIDRIAEECNAGKNQPL